MAHLALKSLALKVHTLGEGLFVNGEIEASLKVLQKGCFVSVKNRHRCSEKVTTFSRLQYALCALPETG